MEVFFAMPLEVFLQRKFFLQILKYQSMSSHVAKRMLPFAKMTMENSNCRRFLATSTQWVEIDKKNAIQRSYMDCLLHQIESTFSKKIISNGGSHMNIEQLYYYLYSVLMLNYRAIFDTPHQYTCLTLPGNFIKNCSIIE